MSITGQPHNNRSLIKRTFHYTYNNIEYKQEMTFPDNSLSRDHVKTYTTTTMRIKSNF